MSISKKVVALVLSVVLFVGAALPVNAVDFAYSYK